MTLQVPDARRASATSPARAFPSLCSGSGGGEALWVAVPSWPARRCLARCHHGHTRGKSLISAWPKVISG